MKKTATAVCLCLSLTACKVPTVVTTADTTLQDKCSYLASAAGFAQLGVAIFYPSATTILADATALIKANCTGKPITDLPSALDRMESIIVAVRPIAAAVGPIVQ